MNLLPVAYRELVVLARRPGLYWMRFAAGLVVALLSTGVILTHYGAGATPASLGGPLFRSLSYCAATLCLFAGPVLLADSLAEEKRAGTLGLLFLTDLRSHDIVAGKMTGLAMPAVQGLLAILPVMTVGFFLGGVTGGEFARTALALLNLLFLSLAVGVLCSAVLSSGRRAFAVSLGLLGCSGLSFWALEQWATQCPPWLVWLLEVTSTPAAAVPGAWDGKTPCDLPRFQLLLAATHGAAWLCVAAACVVVGRVWRDRAEVSPWRRRRAGVRRGAGLRGLARRQVGSAVLVWLYAAGSVWGLSWLGGQVTVGNVSAGQFVVVAWLLHGAFKLAVGWSAVRALGGERDSGALEMLFVTPVGEVAVWQAWLEALRWRFLRPALLLAAGDIFLAWRWSLGPESSVEESSLLLCVFLGVVLFLLDCYALAWVGMWEGLVARTATRATVRTVVALLVLPSLGCLPLLGLLGTGAFVPLVWLATCVWFGMGFLADVGLGVKTMVRVSDDLREAVLRRVGG